MLYRGTVCAYTILVILSTPLHCGVWLQKSPWPVQGYITPICPLFFVCIWIIAIFDWMSFPYIQESTYVTNYAAMEGLIMTQL